MIKVEFTFSEIILLYNSIKEFSELVRKNNSLYDGILWTLCQDLEDKLKHIMEEGE